MIRSRHVLVAAAVAAAVSVQSPASGQDKKAETAAHLVADLALAAQLADFGRGGFNERDGLSTKAAAPEALVTAGALLLRTYKLTGGKMGTIEDAPKEGGKAAAAVPLDKQAEALFDEARAAAGANSKAVDALIDEVMKPRDYDRGSVGGPSTVTRSLNGGETHTYNFNFYSGQPAAVSMTSTGPARIQFDMTNVGGTQLVAVRGLVANYSWTPPRDRDNVRRVTVTLTNQGNRPTTYTLNKN